MFTDFLAELRKSWGWFLALGIALIAVGAISLAMPLVTTFASVVFFGWALIAAGLFEAIALMRARHGGLALSLLGCGFSIVVGTLVVRHPAAGAVAMTVLLAAFFIAGGIARIVASAAIRFPGWGWSLVGGVVTVALGVIVELSWPISTLWLIGTVVGVEILSRGLGWVTLAFAARRMPDVPESEVSGLRHAA